jgi:hypothetical protein
MDKPPLCRLLGDDAEVEGNVLVVTIVLDEIGLTFVVVMKPEVEALFVYESETAETVLLAATVVAGIWFGGDVGGDGSKKLEICPLNVDVGGAWAAGVADAAAEEPPPIADEICPRIEDRGTFGGARVVEDTDAKADEPPPTADEACPRSEDTTTFGGARAVEDTDAKADEPPPRADEICPKIEDMGLTCRAIIDDTG